LAIEVAAADPSRDGLVHLMRNCLLYATLGMRSTQLPPELLGVLAQTGESARALDYAELIQDRSKKSKAYCLIGQALMAQDNTEAGKQAMSQALAVAEAMTNESDKADGLSGVAEAMARAGDLTAAGRVATRALAVAESMWNPIRAADALAGVAQAMVQAGDLAAAGRVASQALVAAEAITYGPDKAPALTGVARAMAQARLDAKALHVLQCAFNTGRLAGRSSVFDVLSGCGSILAAIDGSKTLWRICEAFQEVETWWSWQ
jgi:tetratricopeptide (TPR) repeat protein